MWSYWNHLDYREEKEEKRSIEVGQSFVVMEIPSHDPVEYKSKQTQVEWI